MLRKRILYRSNRLGNLLCGSGGYEEQVNITVWNSVSPHIFIALIPYVEEKKSFNTCKNAGNPKGELADIKFGKLHFQSLSTRPLPIYSNHLENHFRSTRNFNIGQQLTQLTKSKGQIWSWALLDDALGVGLAAPEVYRKAYN